MSVSARKEYIKNFVKLKKQEEALDKGNEFFMNTLKINLEILRSLKEERELYLRDRNKLIKQLGSGISEYNLEFNKIKEIINQFNNGQIIDVNDCKTKMINLLEKFQNFDVTTELEVLEKEQKDLEDFYYDFKANIAKLDAQKHLRTKKSAGINSGPSLSSVTMKINNNSVKYDEIKNFSALITQTGHTQNWKDEDHRLFLKVRNKCHSIPEMIGEIQKKYPDITVEQIVNHEAWYKVYLDLREKQRTSLKEWRMKKDLEKREKLKAIKNVENNTGSVESDSKCKIKSNEIKFNSIVNESSKIFRSAENTNRSLDKKELIRQWKIHKQLTKLADEERINCQNELERMKNEKKFYVRTLKVKAAVNEYKQKKNRQILELSICKNKNIKIIKSPEIIMNFRKQDEAFVRRKLKLLELKNKKIIKKPWINNNYINESNARSPDQSTLMKPTKIWSEKCKSELPKHKSSTPSLYIKDIPKLSLHWRNAESLT